jgi:exopolyphosphatase/guanosine-5'-triphosphate,3'-diphosphate pyrophosphatase
MTRSLAATALPRCACIDIGSNTTRLLVAEADGSRLREVVSQRAFTRMSASDGDGVGQHKIAEVAAIVARQVRLADELGARSMRVIATAAVRDAIDKSALALAIEACCGATLEILSGEEEARLAFAGAIGMLPDPPAGRLGVVDVGGGSTELVVGTAAEGAQWSVSLPVGSARLTRSNLPSDPPTPAELAALRLKLVTLFGEVDPPRPVAAYAVGGSATSIQRLMGAVLDRDALTRGLQTLVRRPSSEIAVRLGLHAERARLLPAGILLLDAASRALGAPLLLAGGGLREGVVLEQLAGLDA